MQIAVVVNPTSGKGRGEQIARTAEAVPRALTMIAPTP